MRYQAARGPLPSAAERMEGRSVGCQPLQVGARRSAPPSHRRLARRGALPWRQPMRGREAAMSQPPHLGGLKDCLAA